MIGPTLSVLCAWADDVISFCAGAASVIF